MSQKTNLNISPYYDDFNVDKNFYKVLFKPGYPVQARELTTLQSILQHQVESFGKHIFQEGSMVIPGSVTYDSKYFSVKINQDNLGVDVTLYLSELVGKRILGQTSGVNATVVNYSVPPNDNVDEITIYVKYTTSGDDFAQSKFSDDEVLILKDSLTYGNTTINSGDTIASVIKTNATSTGSAVGLSKGVYFIRGYFVDVASDSIVLEPYSNTPSYRVGLTITEELVTADDDTSLNDNARGFSNYAAPGADRFKISTMLSKKSLDDFNDTDFIELVRIDNGEIKKLQDTSVYSTINDYLAKRTFDESGSYSIGNFSVDVLNSLNDRISNNGIYLPTQKTEQGNTPSDDLMCVRVSPGTAYVQGFDISLPGSTTLDVEKPRDTSTISSSSVSFEMGNLLRINNAYGTPYVGINNNNNVVSLLNLRKSSSSSIGAATTIGQARIFSYKVTDAEYSNATTKWDLYMFDVQTYTSLTLNEVLSSTQCPATSYVVGSSSNASGYIVSAPNNSKTITLSQTSGSFIVGEQLSINGTTVTPRSVVSVKQYTTDDIKSVYQNSPGITATLKSTFSGDTVLYTSLPKGFSGTDSITITSSGIVTCPGKSFLGIGSDSIIRYQKSGLTDATYNRVVSVSPDGFTMTVAAIASVSGVCDGALPSSTATSTFSLGLPKILNSDKSALYTKLNSDNISSVNLSSSNLIVSTQVRERSTDSNGSMTITVANTGITSAFFTPFDTERYSIFYSDGTIEPLSSDQFTLNADGSQVTFTGLKPSLSNNITVNATLIKQLVKSKSKIFTRSEKVYVNKTSSGVSTSTNGLSTNSSYGLRIEDEEISLNVPDATNIVAVYESLNSSVPSLDKLNFVSGLNLNTATILGEKIIGSKNGAIAQLVTRASSTQVEFVYLNALKFETGETVTFEESNITTNIQSIVPGSYLNITKTFTLDKGQKEQYYDYSKIVRVKGSSVPTKQLLVIFNYYTIPSNDSGDIITVNSYPQERFANDIPIVGDNYRSSDTIDFRPRVSQFTSTSSSPFDFTNRTFTSSSVNEIITPNENSILGYTYYLPRIDKIVLNKSGQFSLIKGTSSTNPKEPLIPNDVMDIATIGLPAYLYSPKDATITLKDNRRYTMSDIRKLEDRIVNLETTTSLTLLELNAKTLQVQDADGLSRFKTGFAADSFQDRSFIDDSNSDVSCDIIPASSGGNQLAPSSDSWSIKPELALASNLNSNTADLSQNVSLLDSNVKKTGNIVTLDYKEKGWIEQPLASGVENVNPFNVVEFKGNIKLMPSFDQWVQNIKITNVTTEENTINRHRDGNGHRYTTTTTDTTEKITSDTYKLTLDQYARSRNVEFNTTGLKPLTQHYSFIDNVSSIDIIPKLIEISMVSGAFSVGEDVEGYVDGVKTIKFRLASPNHKTGSYDNPSTTYSLNPYTSTSTSTITLPSAYSSSSTVLNVDTYSFADESITKYGGYLQTNLKLVGKTSNAVATVSNIRLITDNYGDLIGAFFIRDPNSNPQPLVKLKTGQREFKISSSSTGSPDLPGETGSNSSGIYTSEGSTLTETVDITKTITTTVTTVDPLAQTFTVDETGAFLTSVDVYFGKQDPNTKLQVQLRTVELGTPTLKLVNENARVELEPSQIKTSKDASVKTNIKFPSPIYLEANKEYALVFLSPTSDNFELWVGTQGQKTINTQDLPNAQNVIIPQPYNGGSLFKSQNGSIWSASQYQDLKFKLYKAEFTSTSGDVVFYNPPLRANENVIPYLQENSVISYPRKLKVGITTTYTMSSILSSGRKVSYDTNGSGVAGATGFIEFVGGPISTVSIANTGIGYTYGGSGSYSGVPLYTISGNGSGATATVTVSSSGYVTNVSIASTGSGYVVGDILGITTSSVTKGSGAKISVQSIGGSIDTLYLTNVQGESFNDGKKLIYYNGTSTVSCANTNIRGNSTTYDDVYTGNVIEIVQNNHGMQADNNVVKLKNIAPNTVPVQITADLSINASTISVASTSEFGTFEGIPSSTGYVKIEDEIIYYNSINVGTIGIGTRGIDGTSITKHNSGSVCYKYELNGISLTRINTTFNMPSNTTLNDLRDYDSYFLEVNRGTRSSGDTQLNFTEEKFAGGSNISASQNYQFNTINPQFGILTPTQTTSFTSQMRTVSGTSAGGSEASFLDQGYEPITLGKDNVLNTPRLICSEPNEQARLASLPNNKSLTLRVRLNTTDTNLSPIIDLSKSVITFKRNRINNPISDYAFDGRVNQITGDPHSATYISNRIDLSQPATSLKVLIAACRPGNSDFRVLYRLFKADSSEISQSFRLFPGYGNIQDLDFDGLAESINPSLNNGNPDIFVTSSTSNSFKEYQFTADNLEQFTGFAIKIVMSSTNEANPPLFKDLRIIALA